MASGKKRTKGPKADIRRRILDFLKSRGQAGIDDVARHLRIGHEGARKQLALMESYGWVTRDGGAGPASAGAAGSAASGAAEGVTGKGRPKAAYRVTAAGEHLLPKAYDRLSIALFSSLAGQGGAETLRKVLASLADRQVEAWKPALAGLSAKDKLAALRSLYQEDDPFMSVEERGGDLVLVERNCPFLSVAMAHPALCSLSVMTLERLLGRPVTREERFQAGHGRCVFRIRGEGPPPKPGFRLEAD
jgi:predicted ArsR family transcriptional regulator